MTTQTVIHITPDEIRLMMREEIRAVIAENTPTQSEPDPNELWTSARIADASGYSVRHINKLLNELAENRHITIRKVGNFNAIPYKHIKEMKLKNFNPNK